MSLRPALLTAALALALTAIPAGARADEPACTGALSGAFAATFKCAVTVRDLGDGTAVIDLKQTEKVEGIGAFGVGSWIIPGKPSRRSYSFDALGLGKSSVILDKDGALFTASRTMRSRGEVSLELTSVAPAKSAPGTYAVHGSFRARLIPMANARKDEVLVQVTF
jgi:hypothetical protein